MRLLIDTNRLILLVGGLTEQEFIRRHPLGDYSSTDFEKLLNLIKHSEAVVLSPYVLTEVSNLAVQKILEPLRTEIRRTIRTLIETSEESYLSSAEAAADKGYERLGLTDAAILTQLTPDVTLVTADGPLLAIAASRGASVVSLYELRIDR